MNRILKTAAVLGLCLVLSGMATGKASAADDAVSKHMVAQAMLTAHFIAARAQGGHEQGRH